MNRQEKTPFYTELLKYSKSNTTSFDVPGHKLGEIQNDLTINGGEILYKLDANAPIGLGDGESLIPVFTDEIYPIPLTPEILKKNGVVN